MEIVQLELYVRSFNYLANIYVFKPNNRHARIRCYSISNKDTRRRHSSRSGVFLIDFDVVLVSLLLTLNIFDTLF